MTTVAVIGTGNPDRGAGIAYAHADAYAGLDACELVACADIVRERAVAFATEYGLSEGSVYEDYETMLRAVEPDVVSVCTSPAAHADLVVGVAQTGIPDAIHCEKPMADTWAGARQMARECRRHGIQLTINHQRRFAPEWRRAKVLLDDGVVGDLQRIETGVSNLFDWGTHGVDLAHFFNDDRDAEWVLAGLDYREQQCHFGVHHENQGLALWGYENGVHGLASTGAGSEAVGAHHRLVGTDGTIEVHVHGGPTLRVRSPDGTETESFEASFTDHIRGGIEDLLSSLEEGTEPELSGTKALAATEVLFGAYESVRRRGRVEFPLTIDDHPLEAMVEAGDLSPVSPE